MIKVQCFAQNKLTAFFELFVIFIFLEMLLRQIENKFAFIVRVLRFFIINGIRTQEDVDFQVGTGVQEICHLNNYLSYRGRAELFSWRNSRIDRGNYFFPVKDLRKILTVILYFVKCLIYLFLVHSI